MMLNLRSVANPSETFVKNFVGEGLENTQGYTLEPCTVPLKLDQNETPWDWPDDIKKMVLEKLQNKPWNVYPEPYPINLTHLVADFIGIPQENLLLTAGSNHLISLVLSAFRQKGKGTLYVARPSFPLFESHCRYYGIPYTPWELTEDFEYDLGALDSLKPHDTVIFASPNNPTGNVLDYDAFEKLLQKNPEVLFLADEAYYDFTPRNYLSLLEKYANLLILRTFSKNLGSAGLRLGCLLGAKVYIDLIRKVNVPFLINILTISALEVVFSDKLLTARIRESVAMSIKERDRLYKSLKSAETAMNFRVFPSQANFLLVRFGSQEQCLKVHQDLLDGGILVRNVSRGPLLNGCLRLSLGLREHNTLMAKILTNTK